MEHFGMSSNGAVGWPTPCVFLALFGHTDLINTIRASTGTEQEWTSKAAERMQVERCGSKFETR